MSRVHIKNVIAHGPSSRLPSKKYHNKKDTHYLTAIIMSIVSIYARTQSLLSEVHFCLDKKDNNNKTKGRVQEK